MKSPIQCGPGYLLIMKEDHTWDPSLIPSVHLEISQGIIDWGETVTLTWDTDQADLVYIEPNIGMVGTAG